MGATKKERTALRDYAKKAWVAGSLDSLMYEQLVRVLDTVDAVEAKRDSLDHQLTLSLKNAKHLQSENQTLKGLVKECATALRSWGNETDGIPDKPLGFLQSNPWEAYFGCCVVLHWAFEGRIPERYAKSLTESPDSTTD